MRRYLLSKERVRSMLSQLVQRTCQNWERRAKKGPLRLYYRPPSDDRRIGDLRLTPTDPGDEWQLTCNLLVYPNWTQQQVEYFVHDRLVRLPILRGPFGD